MKESESLLQTFPAEVENRGILSNLLRYSTDLLILVKPGIILLVGITTFSASILASPHLPVTTLLLPTLITLLAASGAAVWNHIYDRDLDALMDRTRTRPLPSGRFPLVGARILAGIFILFSLLFALKTGGVLPAFLTLLAILSYAWLYTMVLKRRTPYCTELGGISGSLPPLIGWLYFQPQITPIALFLPMLLFFWQPPHFWILGVVASKEYRKAKIPIFPVTHGLEFTRLRTLGYTLLFLWISLLPLLWGKASWLYGVTSLLLGTIHLFLALRFTFQFPTPALALRFFLFSLFHLFTLSAAISAERLLELSP